MKKSTKIAICAAVMVTSSVFAPAVNNDVVSLIAPANVAYAQTWYNLVYGSEATTQDVINIKHEQARRVLRGVTEAYNALNEGGFTNLTYYYEDAKMDLEHAMNLLDSDPTSAVNNEYLRSALSHAEQVIDEADTYRSNNNISLSSLDNDTRQLIYSLSNACHNAYWDIDAVTQYLLQDRNLELTMKAQDTAEDAITKANQAKDDAITNATNQVNAEADARAQADATLQQNIDAEAQARATADATLQSNIDAEAQARIAAINAEKNARMAQDEILQRNIDIEAATRFQADRLLQFNIDSEAEARRAGDAALDQKIMNETYARQQEDRAIRDEMNAGFQRLDEKINNGVAMSLAVAGLKMPEYDPNHKLSGAIGFGHFHSANAFAVGVFYQFNRDVSINLSYARSGSEGGISAGVSFKF